ncbi:hypothetical protein [Streptomyces sp. NPDC052015]|uniref:hypothetical protein n=1 Tax=Streptomyces sp. NPDC052015 TaxID=3154755 RepID=UPI003424F175
MTEIDSIVITTLAERPSLLPRMYEIAETWPAFIPHDPVGEALLSRVAEDFPRYCVVATDGDRVVARGLSVPFNTDLDGREETPDKGWDQVLVWAFRDRHGVVPSSWSPDTHPTRPTPTLRPTPPAQHGEESAISSAMPAATSRPMASPPCGSLTAQRAMRVRRRPPTCPPVQHIPERNTA